MNYHELQEAKESFNLVDVERTEKRNETLRKNFVKFFTLEKIKAMTLDEYVEGKKNHQTFCYRIERELDCLGRITGQGSSKFAIWYSPSQGNYSWNEKVWGNSRQEAFKNIKEAIIEIIECGKIFDFNVIKNNRLHSFFKGKILSVFYPDKYLNIFSEPDINRYLTELNLDNKELMRKSVVEKREALLKFKNCDKDMKNWSVRAFATFLRLHFPEDKERGAKPTETNVEFPVIKTIGYVNLSLVDAPKETPKNKNAKVNVSPDYEKEARRNKKLGDRGEKIVYDAEIERIRSDFDLTEAKAKKKVKWVSRDSDAYGYDILSVNKGGTPRYIEVKATQGDVGDMDFYYTQNELETAKKYGKDYYIYIVYNILSSEPKIWVLQNPFLKKGKLELLPIKYKVKVRTK